MILALTVLLHFISAFILFWNIIDYLFFDCVYLQPVALLHLCYFCVLECRERRWSIKRRIVIIIIILITATNNKNNDDNNNNDKWESREWTIWTKLRWTLVFNYTAASSKQQFVFR